MKFVSVLILLVYATSCSLENKNVNSFHVSSNSEQNKNTSAENNSYQKILEENKIKAIKAERLRLKKEVSEMSKDQNLSDLETEKISASDLEVRFRKQSAWWKAWLLILKRTNNNWSVEYYEQDFHAGTSKLKNVSKQKLGDPKSGWETFWNRLISEELMTLPDGLENGGNDPCPDCGSVLIETNIAGEYKIYLYTQPSLQNKNRETRQIAKISNIIAEEFDLRAFETENPIE